MANWATSYSFGGPNWAGNPPIATLSQLNSSIGYTSTVSNALSSTTGVVSNALQIEINNIVAGGTTSLWANYAAISNINVNGCNIYNCSTVTSVFLSTLDLQVSSINGTDIKIFNSTVTIAGVVINNGTVTTTNITNNPAKGGGGGGGNNPTTGGSGNSTWQMINNSVGAVMDTVSKTQQAISGVLNNTGAVLFQTYYAVETAGAVIDLANGAVQLATNAQAMYDTREQNLIAGPAGPPGQTSYVYETISGTTQLQFSTLGTSVYSVFRTTDQPNPNQTFGREIFTSTIIAAGSKVVRSVSDPYQFPIISTIAISTTNYLQSFGQWHAILEPDYNLFASTLTANNIYGNYISSGNAYVSSINANSFSTAVASISSLNANAVSTATATISSINGYSVYQLINSTPSNLSANTISTSFLQVSTLQAQTAYISSLFASTVTVCNIIDNYVSTTTGYFDTIYASSIQAVLTPYFQSTTTQTFDSISSIYQPIINAQLTGSDSGPQQFGLQDYQIFDAANIGFWNGKAFKNFNAGTSIINFISGGIQDGAYIDISVVTGGTINVIDRGGLVISLATAGTTNRITWKASLVVFAVTTAPAPTITTLGNSFTLGQSFDAVLLSTPYQFIINAGETVFNQQLTANDSLIGNKLSFLSSIQTNSITFTGLPANPFGSYDLNRTFASTTTQNYNAVSSLTQNILNYNLSATAASGGVVNFGFAFVCSAGNIGDWNQQVLTTNYPGNTQITGYPLGTTAYYDVYRSGPYPITIYDFTTGKQVVLFTISGTDTTTYRVTGTVSGGTTTWSYTTSPAPGGSYTTTNNLTISQDLQNVYISTLNRIQFNAGDIYMNGSLLSPTAFVDNLYVTNSYFSTISTLNLNIGNIKVQNEIIGDLVVTNNISCANQVAVLQADGNAALVRAFEIYTKYPGSTGDPVSRAEAALYGPYWDTISNVKMLTSQLNYNVWDGYVNTGLGYVSNITFDSNFDLYVNNVFLGKPTNKGSLAFTAVAYNGSLGTYPGCLLRTLTTLPASLGTALNAYTLTLSNSSGSGGSDYVTLYGSGWDPSQIGNIYMPTYSTGNPAFIYNQAGSNKLNIIAGSPGMPFPNTTKSAVTDIVEGLVHVAGGPSNNGILVVGAPNLWFGGTCNIDMRWGSNGYISYNQKKAYNFTINGSYSSGPHGYINNNGGKNSADYNGAISFNGQTFNYADYSCTVSMAGIHLQKVGDAIDQVNVWCQNNGGLWWLYCYLEVQPYAGEPDNNPVAWDVTVTLSPTGTFAGSGVYDLSGSPVLSTINTGLTYLPNAYVSSMVASTVTIRATENISLNANVSTPTFLGVGNVTLNAFSNIDLMANYDIITGADREIDMTGASTIRFTSAEIRAHGYTTVKVPGTASIPAVSALALTNGNQYDGAQNKSQIEFQFYGGGFNHYISSRHDANVINGTGNAIDFWLYSVYTGGDAQTASSAPGTGNINVMSLTASNVVITRPIQISDSLTGGTGTLSVDSGNHLYWNGTLIA